jgi:hypothetical protein
MVTILMNFNFLFSKSVLTSYFCFLVVIFWLLGSAQYANNNDELTLFIKVNHQCAEPISQNKNIFHLYLPDEQLANELKPYFCSNPVVAKQYGQVYLHWGYNLSDEFDFIGKGQADLILTKKDLMTASKGEYVFNYTTLLAYSNYTAYFISLNEKPLLEKEYLIDKRIGLLDYPSSQSGYILPRQLFKKLKINVDNLAITLANSHNDLRDLLAQGKVDLIASYWKKGDMGRFLQNYITAISDNVTGSRWYFKKETQNTELMCAIEDIIKAHSNEQNSPYYKEITSYVNC